MKKFLLIVVLAVAYTGCQKKESRYKTQKSGGYWSEDIEMPEYAPKNYICYLTDSDISVDGVLDETSWQKAPWTDPFQDIRGDGHPQPLYETKAKMLWDENYFYVAARLEEPHVHGKITKRDAVIFRDNDFEVFIDPDGDTHLYYEFEMNALNTIWDLMLVKPYRDGGPPIDALDTRGIQSAVYVNGTLNDSSDEDSCWCIEIAFPLEVLAEFNKNRKPADGAQWRINFSRVQWHTNVTEGQYRKRKNPETGESLPEENWVWSPQGVVDMHRPETWGFVQFSDIPAGAGTVDFEFKPHENIKWALRNVYFAQRKYYSEFGEYTGDVSLLARVGFIADNLPYPVNIQKGWGTYDIRMKTDHGTWFINNEGRTWSGE